MSNSKLTDYERISRKEFIAENPNVKFFSFPDMGATVAIRETGETMGEFSVSIMSRSERKFRRKVGEYHALSRMDAGQVLPVYIGNSDLETIARGIASAVSLG